MEEPADVWVGRKGGGGYTTMLRMTKSWGSQWENKDCLNHTMPFFIVPVWPLYEMWVWIAWFSPPPPTTTTHSVWGPIHQVLQTPVQNPVAYFLCTLSTRALLLNMIAVLYLVNVPWSARNLWVHIPWEMHEINTWKCYMQSYKSGFPATLNIMENQPWKWVHSPSQGKLREFGGKYQQIRGNSANLTVTQKGKGPACASCAMCPCCPLLQPPLAFPATLLKC